MLRIFFSSTFSLRSLDVFFKAELIFSSVRQKNFQGKKKTKSQLLWILFVLLLLWLASLSRDFLLHWIFFLLLLKQSDLGDCRVHRRKLNWSWKGDDLIWLKFLFPTILFPDLLSSLLYFYFWQMCRHYLVARTT